MKKELSHSLKRLALLEQTYDDLLKIAQSDSKKVFKIKDPDLLTDALALFGPQLQSPITLPLQELYELAVHIHTGAIIIASRPATLVSKTTQFSQPFLTHFQSIAIYMPNLGIEVAAVGRVGEISSKPYVLRSESACTPSFLFASKQCNCASQWRCTQELAAYFNSNDEPNRPSIGFLMIHLDSQNGMGMGYTPETFAFDLGTRALLRHAAGLSASEHHQLSLSETFETLGLPPDPRQAAHGAGYKITPIILDFLEAHAEPILLSNNPNKIAMLKQFGYRPSRLQLLGEITTTGLSEAKQRAQSFNHSDIGEELSSFQAEYNRLKIQIQSTCQSWENLC